MLSALAICRKRLLGVFPPATTICCRRHASNPAPAVTIIDAALNDLIGDSDPNSTAREVGRRCHRAGLGSSCKSTTRWKTQRRKHLASRLEVRCQKDTAQDTLTREFSDIMHSLGSLDRGTVDQDPLLVSAEDGVEPADDNHGRDSSMVDAAWEHYSKIRLHTDAVSLLKQVPLTAIHLLILELTFLRGPAEYRRRFERVVQIFNDYAGIGRPITSPLYFSMYLRALNKLGRHQQAIGEAVSYGPGLDSGSEAVLSIGIKRQVMEAYFGGGRPDKALEVFYQVRDSAEYRDSITPHVFASAISGALRAKYLTSAELYSILEDLLHMLERPSFLDGARTGLLNELLHVANKTGNHAFLFYAFERFVDRGFPINPTTFGILIHCSCAAETDVWIVYRVYRAIATHPWMKANMTQSIFAIFINCFVHHRRIDYALSVLHDLRLHPTACLSAQHLSLIFSYYAESGMAVQALELYHTVVDTDKLAPTWTACVDVIKAVGRGGNLSWALETVAAADAPETPGDEASHGRLFDALLTILVKFGQTGGATHMLEAFFTLHETCPSSALPFVAVLMQARHIAKQHSLDLAKGPTAHFVPLVSRLDETQHRDFVNQLGAVLDLLLASSANTRFPQNLYNMAISVFAIIRDHSSVQRIYNHMTQTEGIEPTSRTFNILLQSLLCGLDLASATDVLKDLRERDIPLNRVAANMLIHSYLNANQPLEAIGVYAQLVGRPMPLIASAEFQGFVSSAPIDTHTFALLVGGLVDAGLLKEAIVVFEDAFTVLAFVPRQLLETLVGKLEDRSLLDLAQLCLKRYIKRVEDSQPAHLQAESDGLGVALPEAAPERLPLSYFGYLMGRRPMDENDDD